jgi:hypothetical protein
MRATYANELEELQAWVEAVRQLPRFLRTKDARALFDELAAVELTGTIGEVASRIGRPTDVLLASLRKCPFGL